jgi:hypothetical protein
MILEPLFQQKTDDKNERRGVTRWSVLDISHSSLDLLNEENKHMHIDEREREKRDDRYDDKRKYSVDITG